MPIDPTIALQAGKTLPEVPQVPNLINDPGKMNQLLQIGGQMRAGRAMQNALTPQGTVDIEAATKNLLSDTNNPAAAYAAMEAIGKLQGIANQQQTRMQSQNKELKVALASFMALGNNTTDKDYQNAILDAHKRGLIPAWMAAQEVANTPVDPQTGKYSPTAAHIRARQMYLQTLDPADMRKAIFGGFDTIDLPDKTVVVQMSDIPSLQGNAAKIVEITKGRSPEGKAARVSGPPGKEGEPRQVPSGALPVPGVPPESQIEIGRQPLAPEAGASPTKTEPQTLYPESAQAAMEAIAKIDPKSPTARKEAEDIIRNLPVGERKKFQEKFLGGGP